MFPLRVGRNRLLKCNSVTLTKRANILNNLLPTPITPIYVATSQLLGKKASQPMKRYALLFSCASASRKQASLAWSNCLAFLKATAARKKIRILFTTWHCLLFFFTTAALEFSYLKMQTGSLNVWLQFTKVFPNIPDSSPGFINYLVTIEDIYYQHHFHTHPHYHT